MQFTVQGYCLRGIVDGGSLHLLLFCCTNFFKHIKLWSSVVVNPNTDINEMQVANFWNGCRNETMFARLEVATFLCVALRLNKSGPHCNGSTACTVCFVHEKLVL